MGTHYPAWVHSSPLGRPTTGRTYICLQAADEHLYAGCALTGKPLISCRCVPPSCPPPSPHPPLLRSLLDPQLATSYPSAILARERAIVVNLEYIKCIIAQGTLCSAALTAVAPHALP